MDVRFLLLDGTTLTDFCTENTKMLGRLVSTHLVILRAFHCQNAIIVRLMTGYCHGLFAWLLGHYDNEQENSYMLWKCRNYSRKKFINAELLLPLRANTRLARKYMTGTNTLAFFVEKVGDDENIWYNWNLAQCYKTFYVRNLWIFVIS